MRFVFRADASNNIGSGHVMRSSAIAEEVINRGIDAIFVGKISNLPWVSARIKSLGFLEILECPADFAADASRDILIIDSYEIPLEDEFIQPANWHKVINIFDELTPDYSCDLGIHPGLTNAWPKKSWNLTLSGSKYVPLRKSIGKSSRKTPGGPLKVLVVGGGSDAFGFVPAVAKVLSELPNNFQVTLFGNISIGKNYDQRFVVSEVGPGLDLVSNSIDLVFTTASTTSLEFLARGAAVAIGCAVNNQSLYYKELSDGKYAAPIGEFLSNMWHLDAEMVRKLINSEELRSTLQENSAKLIDLDGAKRIVDEILKL